MIGVETAAYLLLVMVVVTSCSEHEELTRDISVYNGSDFKGVLQTSLFVDKSLLIKRFFDITKHGSGLLVRTPRYYGKSTNMDMVKRFFEMNIDENGNLMDVEKTENYDLFRNNFLNIYRFGDFFRKHIGKYPVILIDYKPLSIVSSVEEMLAVFYRIIMMKAFSQHAYLINDTYLWSLNDSCNWISKERFEKHLSEDLSYKLTESEVQTGFSFLAKLLHKRFEKGVIVLLDNYDAFVDSKLYSWNPKIFHFISAINNDLLRCESVERSLVTGPIRTSGPAVDRGQVLPSCVEDSTSDHKVWLYYGLSGVELEHLLQSIVGDDEMREKAIGRIVHSYSGYSVATFEAGENNESGQLLDTQTCSVWSVVKYMEKELAVENFSSLV